MFGVSVCRVCVCDGIEIDENSKYAAIGFEAGHERQPETDVMNWKLKSKSFLSIYVGFCVMHVKETRRHTTCTARWFFDFIILHR